MDNVAKQSTVKDVRAGGKFTCAVNVRAAQFTTCGADPLPEYFPASNTSAPPVLERLQGLRSWSQPA
jgi:hypothetical protein